MAAIVKEKMVETEFDIIIKDAVIVDGSGNPRRKGDLGIRKGRICGLGRVEGSAGRILDGSGKILCPGFVDPHNHSDLFLLEEPLTPILARQGITTYACGNCGMSPVGGVNNPYIDQLSRDFGFKPLKGITGFGNWLELIESEGVSLNMIPLAGHNTLRSSVLGSYNTRASSPSELREIRLLSERALNEGACGISLGLDGGKPGFFADFEELLEIGRITAELGGLLVPHTRHHQYNWPASKNIVDSGYGIFYGPKSEAYYGRYHGHMEAIEIAEKTGVQLHIAHMSIPYLVHQPHPDWLDEELARATLEHVIDSAVSRGIAVTFDVIPNIESIATERPLIDSFAVENLKPEEIAEEIGKDSFRRRMFDYIQTGRLKFAWIHPLVDPYWMDCFRIISCKEKSMRGKLIGDLVRERNKGRIFDAVYKHSFEILFDIIRTDPKTTWAPVKDKRQTGMSTMLKHPRSMPCTDLVVPRVQANPESIYGVSPYTTNVFPDYLR